MWNLCQLVGIAQNGVWVDRHTIPVMFWISKNPHREMEVVVSCSSVAGIAYKTDRVALSHKLAFFETLGVSLKVGVIEDKPFTRRGLVDCDPAFIAKEQPDDPAFCRGDDGGAERRRDIDRMVGARLGPRVVECIAQLICSDSNYWNNERWQGE